MNFKLDPLLFSLSHLESRCICRCPDISRLRHEQRSWDNPDHCLASERNVESGIVDTLHRLLVAFSYNHVEDYEDESAVEDLPWEAQMNCHTDYRYHRLLRRLV